MFHMCTFSSVNPNILRPPPFLYSSSLVLSSILTPLERARACSKGQEQNIERSNMEKGRCMKYGNTYVCLFSFNKPPAPPQATYPFGEGRCKHQHLALED